MKPIAEDDLHAYVDGALDEARRLEVEAWLASHAEDAERVRQWTAQNQALHAAFDPVLNEPLPLDLIRTIHRRPGKARIGRAAAGLLALGLAGLLGYGVGQQNAPADGIAAPLATLSRDAALAHVVFTPEQRHPVEVEAAHADHLVAWLSKRLGSPLAAPDFAPLGFDLLGGRLLSDEQGPVAQFMYQDESGQRVTLYVRRADQAESETAFRRARENGVQVFYWIDRNLGYALSGTITPGQMEKLAEAAYAQLEQDR